MPYYLKTAKNPRIPKLIIKVVFCLSSLLLKIGRFSLKGRRNANPVLAFFIFREGTLASS